MKKFAVGVDIGGSHISSVLVDIENKKIISESFANGDVNNKKQALNILENWKIVINKTLENISREELAGIGFAMPGPFDYENGIAMFTHDVAKYENLNGVNIAFEIKNLLNLSQSVPVRFMNDATSFAVGEAWIGKTKQYKKSVALTLGTGFGSAFIKNDLPVLEGLDVPELGCLWHIPFKGSIADDYFSTRWYIRQYEAISSEKLSGVKEIAEKVVKEQKARQLFDEFGINLGEFIGPRI